MSFPFFFLAVSQTLGIVFSAYTSIPLTAFIISLIACLLCAWLFYVLKKNNFSFLFILFSTFLFGASLFSYSNENFEENSLHKLKHETYADFYGTVYKSPSRGREKDYLYLRVDRVVYQNREQKIKGNLRITVPQYSELSSTPPLFIHDKIKVSAQLLSKPGFRNFRSSPLDSYLKSQNIHNRAFTKSRLLVEKLKSGKKLFPLRTISIIRQKMKQKIEKHFSLLDSKALSSHGAILEALLLGERRRMDPSDIHSLQKSGLFHLFAISGAHIAIISFLLFSLFKLIRLSPRLSYLLLIVILTFFALLVEGRPSVMRATIMALAFLTGKLLWKKVNLINTISISAFILLLFNPLSLFNVGFQLTFSATFSIILFFPRIIKYMPNLPLKISEILVLSLTAQLGVLPFIASSFNRVAFSSLLLNFAALPLVGLIMACGYIFLPLALTISVLAQVLAKSIQFLVNLLLHCSYIFDKIPLISYRIPTPHFITIIGYFLFLFLFLLPVKFKKQKLAVLLGFLAFFIVLISYPFPSLSKNLKITMIDVGQGESILVELPGRKKMLIDGGGFHQGSFDIGESVVSPFLWRKGIKKIDYLVLTHAHPDHLNGLKAIARNFKIGEYWESMIPQDDEDYKEFMSFLSPSVPRKRVFRGRSFQEGQVSIDTLHPDKGEPFVHTVDNDQSLVLKVSYDQVSFLLTGDIGVNAEKMILSNFKDLKSQVLKSPHHGSRSSSSKVFLERVAPQIILISVGRENRYRIPDKEVLERYKEIGARIYRTDHHGAVEVSTDGHEFSIRTSSID